MPNDTVASGLALTHELKIMSVIINAFQLQSRDDIGFATECFDYLMPNGKLCDGERFVSRVRFHHTAVHYPESNALTSYDQQDKST